MKIIQISDTHMVPPGTALLGLDPRARFEACVADVNADHRDAACCIVTGDLVDGGDPAAYAALRAVLAGLAVPWHLLIGNHDDRGNFRAAFPEAPLDPNGFVQQAVESAAGRLLLLDTHEPGRPSGSYCARRADWLREQLTAAGDAPVYLFMHHPPFDIRIPSLDNIRLEEPDLLTAAVADRANLRHIFFGHVHRPVSGSWRGIPFSALRSTVHQVPLDLETVTPVPYDFEPPCYAVIYLEPDQVVVHLHDYLDDSRAEDGRPRYGSLPGA